MNTLTWFVSGGAILVAMLALSAFAFFRTGPDGAASGLGRVVPVALAMVLVCASSLIAVKVLGFHQ